MTVVAVTAEQLDMWVALRRRLWDDPAGSLASEAVAILADSHQAAFLLLDEAGTAVGFIEGALYTQARRPYGYIEGWYVVPEHRGRGHGAALLDALEGWVLHHAIDLMLSDTLPDEYPLSAPAHQRHGYETLTHIQVFIKSLEQSQ